MPARIALPCLLAFLAFPAFGQDAARPEFAARLAEFVKRFPESDANQDGTLTFEEFRAFQQDRQDSPEMQKRRKQTLERFPQADTDKDGTLSLDEMRAFQVKRREMIEKRKQQGPKNPPPVADVPYGEHEKQRFDLWPVPDATEPTPLVLFIHGGGFRGGDKTMVNQGILKACQEAGVAYASMNYRLSDVGPYPIMMHDAARGLQTLRHRAAEWNIDPDRIVCHGGSAGAGISLWLAFHDDLADPESDDPIARQSTRILAAATGNGQSTYDMHTFREWFGVPDLSIEDALLPFYAIEGNEDLEREEIKALMRAASPIAHLSEDDTAAVYMTYSRPNTEVTIDTDNSIWVHHVLLGLKLQEAMEKQNLECLVTGPDVTPENDPYGSTEAFLIAKAKGE